MLARLILLAVLALALFLRPTLSAMGEAHELAHDSAGQHVLFDHGQAEEGPNGAAPDEGKGGSTLHVLAHFAHCCGQGTLAVTPIAAMAITPLPPAAPTPHFQASFSRARWQTPFRPPIVA